VSFLITAAERAAFVGAYSDGVHDGVFRCSGGKIPRESAGLGVLGITGTDIGWIAVVNACLLVLHRSQV
jgi:hypothetical protein